MSRSRERFQTVNGAATHGLATLDERKQAAPAALKQPQPHPACNRGTARMDISWTGSAGLDIMGAL